MGNQTPNLWLHSQRPKTTELSSQLLEPVKFTRNVGLPKKRGLKLSPQTALVSDFTFVLHIFSKDLRGTYVRHIDLPSFFLIPLFLVFSSRYRRDRLEEIILILAL